MFTCLQKEKPCIKSLLNTFEFKDQGKFNLICLPENAQVSSVASEGQIMIFRQNKKNVHIFILFKSIHTRLLMHVSPSGASESV